MRRSMLLAAAAMQLLFTGVQANEFVAANAQELERLGVSFSPPERAEAAAGLSAPGRIVVPPAADFAVSSLQAGLVSRLLVAAGEHVSAGQVIAELRSPDLVAAQREYLDALAEEGVAGAALARDEALQADGIISERRLQETRAAAVQATTKLAQSKRLLTLTGMSADDIQRLRDERTLSDTLAVRAPVDGVVLERYRTVGQRVEAMEPIYRVADLSTLWLEMQLPQEQAGRMREGMPVSVKSAQGELQGAISNIGHVVDPETQTVLARAVLQSAEGRLRAGEYVTARVVTRSAGEAPLWAVPARAAVRSGDQRYIFLRVEGGYEACLVRPVDEDGEQIYLTAEVGADTAVAVTGIAALKALWLSRREDRG